MTRLATAQPEIARPEVVRLPSVLASVAVAEELAWRVATGCGLFLWGLTILTSGYGWYRLMTWRETPWDRQQGLLVRHAPASRVRLAVTILCLVAAYAAYDRLAVIFIGRHSGN